MLTSESQYRRACVVVAELEVKVKLRTATEAERARYQAGCEEIVIWGWSSDDSRPAAIVVPELPKYDPRAVGMADWWERNRHRINQDNFTYTNAYDYCTRNLEMTPQEDLILFDDYCAIIHERRLVRGLGPALEPAEVA